MDQQKLVEKLTEIGGIEENMVTRKRKIMDEIMKEMSQKDEEIAKLKMKMEKMEVYLKELKSSIRRRKLPAELMNELLGSLPFENAFGFLVTMPNVLLARNVQKMVNGIKEAMKNNKLNAADCSPNLTISEGGLVAKHSGQHIGCNSVRAILPIPTFTLNAFNKPTIVFYFEMEILNKTGVNIGIGFCDQQFSLEGKWLGIWNTNSIGILCKNQIEIDGSWTKIGNNLGEFKKGDSVGLGIIHHRNSQLKYFATWNGQLIPYCLGPPKHTSKMSCSGSSSVKSPMCGPSCRGHSSLGWEKMSESVST